MQLRRTLPSFGFLILGYVASFLGHVIQFLHRQLDRVIAVSLYFAVRWVGEGIFSLETLIREYLVGSKYVANDSFEVKLDDDRIICLWMGLQEAESITLREISFQFGVSDHYARKIRKAAKNWAENFPRFAEIMKSYRSDSEKGDRRSGIKN